MLNPDSAGSHQPVGNTGPLTSEENKAFSIDYRRLWETTKKYFWLIILYVIAGIIAAVVYLTNATPIYRSIARIKVEQRVMDATPTSSGGIEEDLRGLEMLQTIQLGFVSRSLMQRMVQRLNLKKRADFTKSTYLESVSDDEEFTTYLLNNSQSELIQGTRLLTISFDHPDSRVAQEMVDSLIREFVALEGEQRLAAASVNLSYLIEEKKSLEEKLKRSRQDLIDYTRKLGSISISDGQTNIVQSKLIELNQRLGLAMADRLKLQSDNEQISKYRDDPKMLLQISSVAQLPNIVSLKQQVSDLDGEISKGKKRYQPNAPALQQLESQKVSLQKALEAEALQAPETVDRTFQSALQTEQALQRATDEQEKQVIENKAQSIESDKLQGEIDADNLAYQAVLKKLNEETSQARSQPVFIQVVDPAGPAFQVAPRKVQVLAIAIFLSVAASGLTILILSGLDTSFKSVDELESCVGLQVLAAVPQYETKVAKKAGESRGDGKVVDQLHVAVPLIDDPYSAASEAYRTLRASLLLLEDEHHSILVTSAVPEEGKSTTSLSLAVSMAQRGAKTLLVEFDLRKPVLENRLFGRQTHLGAADYLSDRADFDSLIQPTSIPNLSIISAGKVTKSSGELLLRRHKVEKFLELARANFEQVIVDSAPLLAVSDTLTVARHFKVITMVVRSHKTARRLVQRSIDLLKRVKRMPAGITLSMVPPGNAYYYYGYSDGGRAYGAERQTDA